MAVMFSKVPEYYASVFGELTYTMTGIESGTVADAEVYAAGEDTPLGGKRVAGGAAPTVNIACYMRRRIAPVPFSGEHTGFFADAGRSVTAAVGCGGSMSPVRTFTGAVRRLSEYEVLTTLPLERSIAWEESDEVSLLVPGCRMTYSWRACGTEDYEYRSAEYVAKRGVVTLAVGMPSIRQTLVAAGVNPDGISELRVTVRVAGESVAELRYGLRRRERDAVRLCWFNRMGGVDYHTFDRPTAGHLEAWREVFRGRDGYTASAVGLACRRELSSGLLPRLWLEGLACIPASPRVWRVEEDAFVAVDVFPLSHVFRNGEAGAITFTVRDRRPLLSQNL